MKIKQLLIIIIMIISSVGLVGCSSTMDEIATNDEEFIEAFEKIVNSSLEQQWKLWNDFEKYSAYSQDDYINEMTDVLQMEIYNLENNKIAIQDEKLEYIVDEYIKGVNKQIEAINTPVQEAAYCNKQANILIRESLLEMIDEYEIKIKDCNEEIYNEILDDVIIVEKENKPQSFVDKLAKEAKLKMTKDNFGDIKFLASLENTSNLNFKNLSFKVEYKDRSGEVVSHDYITLKNFTPGDIKKIKLIPYENTVVSVDLVSDWYETK